MKKNKILLFLTIFSISIIITFPAFATSHALDSYCTVAHGYLETANIFLESGRLFSALFMYLCNLISLPFDSIGYISALLMNLFLSLAIAKLYLVINKNLGIKNTITKVTLIAGSFLIFYSPLLMEVLLFDEAAIFGLGILFVVLAAAKINDGGILNYFISFIFMSLSVICYQGIACFLFPILLLIVSSKIGKNEKSLKIIIQKLGISILIYGLAFLVSLLVINIIGSITGSVSSKFGSINLGKNLILIFTTLIPKSLSALFGFISPKTYYFIVILLLLTSLYLIVKNKNKIVNIVLLILLISTAILAPFIPNVVMSSEQNYTAARMAITIATIPGLLFIYIITRFTFENNYIKIALLSFSLIVFAFVSYLFIHNSLIDLKRYKEDMRYLKNVQQRIIWYQNETGYKVKTVYWAKDTNVAYYYNFGHPNGMNVRLLAVDWGMECAWEATSNKKYEYKQMSQEKYEEYFANKNYDEFDKEQLKFEKDKLYLLLY